MTNVDAKLITVVQAIRQSIETNAGPGASVNAHPNPFFLNVNGALDLKVMAETVLARLESFEAALKAKIEKSIKDAESAAVAEASKIGAEIKGLEL